MTWKKRIISIALCLCALLCAASVRADAAGAHSHPICGANHKDVGDHTSDNCSTPTWTAWDGKSEITYTNNVAYIYLSDDVTLQINNDFGKPKSLDVGNGKTLYLCLNGHSLTNRGSNTICVYGTLVLCDCKGGGQNNGTITHTKDTDGSFTGSEGIHVNSGATFTMYGGTISGNNGGVQVYESTFTMYGGKISNNASRGVDVYGGTFTMYGGEITDNTFIDSSTSNFGGGAGVRVRDSDTVQGNFAMYGGEISNNTYEGVGDGGGVYASSTGKFIIQDGKITDNHCINTLVGAYGGGLYISDAHSELRIENSTISNNTCDGNGGGIFIISNVTGSITNCTISNNSATDASSKGGGLAFDTATVTITGGSITDNKTMGKGGGMAVGSWGDDSKITLSGSMNFSGNAQGCTADENGKLTGGTANDVHLNTSSVYLRLASDFSKTSAAPIVVTTFSEPTNKTVKIAEGIASVAKATDFTYGNGSNSAIGIIAKTKADGTTVELLACKHNYSQKTDSDNHWYECSICKDKKDVTAHQYNQEKAETGCLKTAATCTAKAVYYKSCVCGATGTATFESGEKNPNNHTGTLGGWQTNSDEHWKVYSCCQTKVQEAKHDWDEGEVTTPATCTADGAKTLTCGTCNATKTEPVPATGHTYNQTKVEDKYLVSAATCTAKAVYYKSCVCGATGTATFESGEKLAHTYDKEVATETYLKSAATCTDRAVYYKSCVCGEKGTETFESGEKLAHTYDKEVATETYLKSAATCTDRAVYYKSCVCGEKGTTTFEYGEKNPNNHTGTLGSWQSNDDGHWKEYSCCQAQSDKAAHTWNEGTVTTPATCTADGVKTLTCGTCNATKTEPVPATGHTYNQTKVEDKYLVSAATCTDKAVYYKSCVCGEKGTETFESGEKNPNNHTGQLGDWQTNTDEHWKVYSCCQTESPREAHSGGEATCTQKAVCEKCGQEYGEKLAHSYTVQEHNEIQHWYKCANCTATTEPVAHTDFTAWKSDRSGHWHECSTCGYKTAVTAHTPDRDKATETEAKVCKDCDWVIDPATHPVHTWVFVAETPATCNAAGEREHYKCTCGRTSFKNGDAYDINEDASVLTIEKNSANHAEDIGQQWLSDSENHWQEYTCCHARANEAAHSGGAATCTAQAVCQVCGRAYGPLAAHDWQPATCTAPKTCSVCHATDGAALGHDWGAWVVTTPATKDAPGVEKRTCAHNSAHTETRSIPKLSTTVYTVSEDTKIAQIEAKVDGLDKILELNENKALVNNGKSVGVSLTVKNTASSGVSEKIKEKLAGNNMVGLRLELTVEKTVTANGVVESKQTIPDTVEPLKTTITLPAELQGKSGYVVYRLHGDAVHVLTETPNENGEFITVSADKTQITICARLYSEYVIAYQTSGSSGGGYHPVNPTPVKATSANTGDVGVLLYGVTAALSLTGTAWLGAKSRKH